MVFLEGVDSPSTAYRNPILGFQVCKVFIHAIHGSIFPAKYGFSAKVIKGEIEVIRSQIGIVIQVVEYQGNPGKADDHLPYLFFCNTEQLHSFRGDDLIESDQVNAWCMPGGKVAFYTGILPICQGDVGVAVVMGHEIAHAIAEHGKERMSHQMAVQMGGMALSEAIKTKPEETRAIYMSAFAVGTHFGAMLPYSRMHESEADHIGLIFMAMAGYDPREAPKFWERMSASGGGKPPEFMSTHPSDATRIRQLNDHMVEALGYYQ